MSPEDEVRLSGEIRMAGKAKMVLENEAFKAAVRALEEALMLGIRQSAFKDKELREQLCQRYSLLHDLIGQLQTHIETGQLAEEEFKQKTLAERAKEFLKIN